MDDLILDVSNGTQLVVPPSLAAITTYVLLEQETWFEKEFAFLEHLLLPGQTAVDVGANLGVFSLALAKCVGPTGRVFAYEPTAQARGLLERSREVNGADHLTILGQALSDGPSGELDRPGNAAEGPGEEVEISTLDREAERLGWGEPDFIKIDAAGEELAILRGGARLLAESSPLLLLRFKAGDEINAELRPAVERLGYQTYRLLPSAALLVPLAADIDGFELHFFAAKPDRAAALAERGLLVLSLPEIAVSEQEADRALAQLRAQPFAAAFPIPFAAQTPLQPQYRQALGAYGIWLDPARPPAERAAALDSACRTLGTLLQSGPQTAWLLTFARVAAEYGARTWAFRALEMLLQAARAESIPLHEPFWPASARFDQLPPAPKPAQWLIAGLIEANELQGRYSTRFLPPTSGLGWLCDSPYASPGMLRRKALCLVRSRQPLVVPPQLRIVTAEHLNAPLWDDGTVGQLAALA